MTLKTRLLAATALALTLLLGFAPTPASAQEEPAAQGDEEKGMPVSGYLGAGALAGAALFIVCKTARR